MAGSNWNQYIDALLATELTVAEHRLALALARLTLGWNRTDNHLGEALLRDTANLDGRNFTRARDALVAKGLLHYEPGTRGRGNRGFYAIPSTTQKPALERVIQGSEKPAPQRVNRASVKTRSQVQEKPASQRGRRGRGKGRTSDDFKDLRRQAFDTYLAAGGTLELDRERGALARSVTVLAKTGVPHREILAAIRDLGRKQEFPGLLKQHIQELAEQGGACEWNGLDRSRLTTTQLAECDCAHCQEWLVFTTAATASGQSEKP